MTDFEREARAARNQAMFRSVNEKIREINQTFAIIAEDFTIACECADATCVEMIDIQPSDYAEIRANPRRFAILLGHVDAAVERVVSEAEGYVVVEKVGEAARLAEGLEPRE